MTRVRFLLPTLLLLAFAAPAAWAQSMFATLSGTVLDSGGAVIVAAAVTIKDAASGETRATTTNRDGYFSVTALPSATYDVIVTARGFEKYRATGIALTGGDDRTMSIPLKVGAASETVEVLGGRTELAQVESGEKSYTISAADLQQLTLVSRDATEIVNMMPGAVMSSNGGVNAKAYNGQTVGLNLNGPLDNENVNGQSVDVTMDGGHTFDPGAYGNSVPVTANQDMISEVKILTSNFTADNAKGPVVVNVVSKSGGSNFHGDFHFNARNHVLNSLESDEKENGVTTKPNESYYYPGATIGGPVIIPGTRFNKNRSKLFFFDGYEFYRQINDAGIDSAFVMTPQMLTGDFSAVAAYGANGATVGGGNILIATPTTPPGPGYMTPAVPATPTTPAVPAKPDPYDGWLALTPGKSVSAARLDTCTVTGGVLSSGCLDPNGVALMGAYMPTPTTPNGAPNSNGFNFVKDITQPMNMTQNMARVDFDYSEKTKLYVTYTRQRQTATWSVGMWANTASENAVPPPTPLLGGDGSDFVSTNFMHVISPTMTSETRFTFTYENYPAVAEDPARMQRADIPNFTLKGIYDQPTAPMFATWGSGFPNLGDVGYQFPLACYKKIPAAGEDLTKVIRTHTAKVGVYWEFINNAQNNWGQWGDLGYGSWTPFVSGNMYADTLMGVGQTGYTEQAEPPQPLEIADNILSFYAQDDWKVTRRLTVQYGVRFDHYGKPYSPPYGLAQFNPATYNNAPSAVGLNTGVSWHLLNPKVPLAGTTSTLLFYSPRLGAAYDVFGNGRTIVRGGYGKYRAYDSVQSNSYTASAQTSIGSVAWSCGQNDPNCPSWEDIDTHAAGPAVFGAGIPAGSLASPNTLSTVNPTDHEQPLVTTYSATVDQKLPARMSFEVSYVGNSSQYFQPQINVNAIPLGAMLGFVCPTSSTSTACQQQFRPYQNYQDINDEMSAGKARFDSLQASLQRTSGFLTLMINYTYSKTLGDSYLGSDSTSGYPDYGVNEFYGISNINRPNVLSTAYVIHAPSYHGGNSIVRGAASGWEISGMTQIESGADLTAGAGGYNFDYSPAADPAYVTASNPSGGVNNTALLGTPDIQMMPLLTCNPAKGNAKDYFVNASCFSLPAGNGVNGTTKLPYIPGPKYWKSDLTAIKNFKIGEHQNAQFRIAGFNFLNHALLSFAPGDSNTELNNYKYVAGTGEVNGNANFGHAQGNFGKLIMELGVNYSF